MDYGLSQKQWFEIKWQICFLQTRSFCLLKMLIDGLDWSGVDYLWIIVMFLSAVWTLILTAPIHCWGSIVEQAMKWHISPNLMKKQTHLHLGWTEGETFLVNFHFWMNYFFNLEANPPITEVIVTIETGITAETLCNDRPLQWSNANDVINKSPYTLKQLISLNAFHFCAYNL